MFSFSSALWRSKSSKRSFKAETVIIKAKGPKLTGAPLVVEIAFIVYKKDIN